MVSKDVSGNYSAEDAAGFHVVFSRFSFLDICFFGGVCFLQKGLWETAAFYYDIFSVADGNTGSNLSAKICADSVVCPALGNALANAKGVTTAVAEAVATGQKSNVLVNFWQLCYTYPSIRRKSKKNAVRL